MLATTVLSVVIACNNLNWEHSPRCTAPVVLETMIVNPWGVSSGELESGVKWTQTRLSQNMALFEAEQMKWLIWDGEIVYVD